MASSPTADTWYAWSLGLKPSTSLTFKWENEGDVPKAVLSATNAGGYYIAYKVKTTKPKRYVVRPPQGIVLPDGTADIQLTMVPGDASSLWAEAVDRSRSNGPAITADDKFLVQMALVSEEFYTKELKDLDDKAQAPVLQKLWKSLTDEDKAREKEKKPKQIKSTKLTTTFEFPDIAVQIATTTAEPPSFDTMERIISGQEESEAAAASAAGASNPSADTMAFAELQSLRKKYDDLVAYTVVLTGERDFLLSENEERKTQLKTAEDQLAKAQRGKAGGAGAAAGGGADGTGAATADAPKGLNFQVVLVVALVAFIFGRIIA